MTIVRAIPLFAALAAAPALYATETTAADQASDVAKSAKDTSVDSTKTVDPTKDTAKDFGKTNEVTPPAANAPAANAPTANAPTANAAPTACPVVRVHFATDSADITADDQAQLQTSAACLKQNPRQTVTVEGNADARGTAEHNQGLSERRAQAVAQYLEGQGIASSQLKTEGFGEDRPVCNDQGEECWSRNRRTAIRPSCHL